MRTLALILLLASSTWAFPKPHPLHYIRTHKELLAADAIFAAAIFADDGSSIPCQHAAVPCIEENGLLGQHPSDRAFYLSGVGISAFELSMYHLLWHYAPDKVDRHIIWFPTTAFAIYEFRNVRSNVHIDEEN